MVNEMIIDIQSLPPDIQEILRQKRAAKSENVFESKSLSSYLSHAIEEYPTSNGPVDYALVDQGQIIALVEAKKLGTGPQNVLVQAQRYAQGVRETRFDFDGFRVPFIYCSQRFQKGDFEDGEAFNPQVLPNSYLTDPQPGHAFVYVCTIQRMKVNLFGWQNSFEASDQDTDDESDATQVDIPIF